MRAGSHRIGTTRRLTPTHAGFRAFRTLFQEVQRQQRKGTRAAWTLDLDIRYRGPDGRFVKAPLLPNMALPRLTDVRQRRRELEKLYRKTKGKKGRIYRSEDAAFRDMAETSIKAAVFRTTDTVKSLRGGTDELMRDLLARDATTKQVRAAFRAFKERRSITFKVTVNRQVPPARRGRKK